MASPVSLPLLRNVCNFEVLSLNDSRSYKKFSSCFPISGATTSDLRNLINEESFEVTLHWVLSIIEKEIQQFSDHPILIDVVPNLKFLSKKGSLVRDCEGEMEQFELDVSRIIS